MLNILPMIDTLTIYGQEGYDDWGQTVAKDPVEVKGNLHYNSTRDLVVGSNGDEVVYTANIYFPVGTKVDYESTIYYKDDYGNELRKKPIRIQAKRDAWGTPLILRVVV